MGSKGGRQDLSSVGVVPQPPAVSKSKQEEETEEEEEP